MTTYARRLGRLGGVLLAAAVGWSCARAPSPGVTPSGAALRFRVLGNASPADTGAPTLRISGQTVTIRGMDVQVEGGGLYGDLDLTEPHTVRLTLYDSLPGRPVNDPPPRSVGRRQVVYHAEVGPLAPGAYDVWVGRFDPGRSLVEVSHAPLRIEVKRSEGADAVRGSDPRH